MRFLRFIRFSHLRKSVGQSSRFNPPSVSSQINFPDRQSKIRYVSGFTRYYTTPSQDSKPVQSEKVSAIVDELMGLTLLEVMDLVEVMREKRGVNELPLMMVMMPGMGIAGGLKGAAKGGGPKGGGEEKKAEKTTFDVKLEAFDAASKIKVIKEVRTFTSLGLKEAKDLVEKVPTLLKKGVTKEEAESIIAKMKEAGAKVTME